MTTPDPRTKAGIALLMAYPDIRGRTDLRRRILAIEEEATVKAERQASDFRHSTAGLQWQIERHIEDGLQREFDEAVGDNGNG